MSGKGSGRRKENTELVRKNWDKIKWTDGGKEELAKHQQKIAPNIIWVDELAGTGDTYEEKVSLSDEMRLHQEKHKPEGE